DPPRTEAVAGRPPSHHPIPTQGGFRFAAHGGGTPRATRPGPATPCALSAPRRGTAVRSASFGRRIHSGPAGFLIPAAFTAAPASRSTTAMTIPRWKEAVEAARAARFTWGETDASGG